MVMAAAFMLYLRNMAFIDDEDDSGARRPLSPLHTGRAGRENIRRCVTRRECHEREPA